MDQKAVSAISELQRQSSRVADKPGYFLPLVCVAGAEPYAADAILYRSPVIRPTTVFRRLCVAVNVAGTNNGGNFWTINLSRAAGVIGSVDTSAVAVATWAVVVTTTGFTPTSIDDTDFYLEIDIVKTGGPGAIQLAPSVYVI